MCFVFAVSCTDENTSTSGNKKEYNEANVEWYPGGENVTVFSASTLAYQQSMPFIDADPELFKSFMRGERIFEKSFVATTGMGYSGLGPAYMRKSCLACHPSYGGHGQRVDKYDASDSRNSYVVFVFDKEGNPVHEFADGMVQTRAVAPFKPTVSEDGITILWKEWTDEYGNKYADGETYSLIYPEVSIAQSAIHPGLNVNMSECTATIASSIGLYGTGLLEAVSDDDIRKEEATQKARGYAVGHIGGESNGHVGRFNFSGGTVALEANSLWEVTSVTHTDFLEYVSEAYATYSSKDSEVQAAMGMSENEVFDYLTKTQTHEMDDDDYASLILWHRGLAVPAARNLDNPEVQRGKKLFEEAGCTACHRPSWTTSSDYKPLPQLRNQKIYPYTDLLVHNLNTADDKAGYAKTCRTTPLWGKGLMPTVSGHSDRWHDLRARNYEEALLGHEGEGKYSKNKFREMSKEDREALIKFLEAI
jgi:CxxC motif-containing protein (DUF1111 family)